MVWFGRGWFGLFFILLGSFWRGVGNGEKERGKKGFFVLSLFLVAEGALFFLSFFLSFCLLKGKESGRGDEDEEG